MLGLPSIVVFCELLRRSQAPCTAKQSRAALRAHMPWRCCGIGVKLSCQWFEDADDADDDDDDDDDDGHYNGHDDG